MFLREVKKIPSDSYLVKMLLAKITVEELWEVILSFKEGKAPGPDGLTIEFYKIVFPIIKRDLLKLYNHFYDSGFIPAKNKMGYITLILKKQPSEHIQNYRPITLMNVDLKIYAKILCTRMKLVLPDLLHDAIVFKHSVNSFISYNFYHKRCQGL